MKLNCKFSAKETKNTSWSLLFWFLLLSVSVFPSTARRTLISSAGQQNSETVRTLAERVLKQAREATRKDLKGAVISSLTINFTSTEVIGPYPEAFLKTHPQYRNQSIQGTINVELGISLPDKIRERIDAIYPTNQWISDRILNSDRFAQKTEVLVDGKPVNFVANNSSLKSEKEQITEYKQSAFITIFPIILDYSWCQPMEFNYIGVAEAGGAKADVIETMFSDGTKYRFFFDQQTYLLLMMIETRTSRSTNKEIERRYFFSDYKKEDRLLVAHKIVTERNKETIAEREIKRLQINPTFKPDYFDLKGR